MAFGSSQRLAALRRATLDRASGLSNTAADYGMQAGQAVSNYAETLRQQQNLQDKLKASAAADAAATKQRMEAAKLKAAGEAAKLKDQQQKDQFERLEKTALGGIIEEAKTPLPQDTQPYMVEVDTATDEPLAEGEEPLIEGTTRMEMRGEMGPMPAEPETPHLEVANELQFEAWVEKAKGEFPGIPEGTIRSIGRAKLANERIERTKTDADLRSKEASTEKKLDDIADAQQKRAEREERLETWRRSGAITGAEEKIRQRFESQIDAVIPGEGKGVMTKGPYARVMNDISKAMFGAELSSVDYGKRVLVANMLKEAATEIIVDKDVGKPEDLISGKFAAMLKPKSKKMQGISGRVNLNKYAKGLNPIPRADLQLGYRHKSLGSTIESIRGVNPDAFGKINGFITTNLAALAPQLSDATLTKAQKEALVVNALAQSDLNELLKLRSGAAVTAHELARLMIEQPGIFTGPKGHVISTLTNLREARKQKAVSALHTLYEGAPKDIPDAQFQGWVESGMDPEIWSAYSGGPAPSGVPSAQDVESDPLFGGAGDGVPESLRR